MHYIPLGDTVLRVSRLCLGCMTFGEPDRGRHARRFRKRAAARLSSTPLKAASTSSIPQIATPTAAAKRSLAAPCATLPAVTRWLSPPRCITRSAIWRKDFPGRRSCAPSTTACAVSGWTMSTCCRSTAGTIPPRLKRRSKRWTRW